MGGWETGRRRPIVWLAGSYVLGTWLGLRGAPPPLAALLALPAAALALPRLGRARRGRALRPLAGLAAAAALAWLLAARAQAARDLGVARLEEADACSGHTVLRGRVSGVVSVRAASRGERCHRFVLRGVTLETRRASLPVPRLPVHVTWYGPGTDEAFPPPLTGETWELRGSLRRATLPALASRFYLTSRAFQSRGLRRLPAHDWRAACQRFRQHAAARLSAGLGAHPDETALIHAMMLGQRGDVSAALNRVFRNSGTIHVFAISGMHVVVISGLLAFGIARCGVPRQAWIVPLAPLLAVYIWMTGGQPSALRAGVMSVLYLSAPLLGRRPDTPATLAAAALLLLALDPLQLRETGFVLSFAVVAGLVALAPPLARRLRRACRLDRLAVDLAAARLDGAAGGRAARLGRLTAFHAGAYLSELVAVSCAAWLTAAPLTAHYFGLFTPASLPANLLVVPLSFLVMALASLSLVAGSLAAPAALALNRLACLCTQAMTGVAACAAGLPGGVWRVPCPPLALSAAWYAALAWWAWRMAAADRPAAGDAAWLEEVAAAALRPPGGRM